MCSNQYRLFDSKDTLVAMLNLREKKKNDKNSCRIDHNAMRLVCLVKIRMPSPLPHPPHRSATMKHPNNFPFI